MTGKARFCGAAALLLALGLGACGTDQQVTGTEGRYFGLVSGPLPQPKPFVVESRQSAPQAYPAVHALPPPRQDKLLTPQERQKLEDSLIAVSNAPHKRRKPPVPVAPQPQG